jgi:hypothetical protein
LWMSRIYGVWLFWSQPHPRSLQDLFDGSDSATAPPISLEDTVLGNSTRPRVAVCLVGGARAFELTGKNLKKYVLNAYNNTDVFLHSPLDKDSSKFTLLSGASGLANARIFIPQKLPESWVQQQVLTGANSPNGIQVCFLKRLVYLIFVYRRSR